MMAITTHDLYWAAGFLEGEGSFGWYPKSLRVSARQVQKEPLERLQQLFGGHIHSKSPKNPRWQDIHEWYVNGVTGPAVAMTLFSLMSTRRKEQIREALSKWRAQGIYNGFKRYCLNGHDLSVPENLNAWRTDSRECRICKHRRQREWSRSHPCTEVCACGCGKPTKRYYSNGQFKSYSRYATDCERNITVTGQ